MTKNKRNVTYVDDLVPFGMTLLNEIEKHKYMMIKRIGTEIRALFWDTNQYEGCQGKRKNYEKKKDGEKQHKSLNRARQEVFELVETNLASTKEKPIFLTLTYAGDPDLDEATHDFTDSMRRLKKLSGIPVRYICVPEFQKRGTPHFHVVIFDLPLVFVNEVAKKKSKKKSIFDFYWSDIWPHGSIDVKKVRNEYTKRNGKKTKNGCAAYMCKYLSKKFQDERLYGRKTYYTSRSLYRPYKMYTKLDDIDTITSAAHISVSAFGVTSETETTFYKPKGDFIILEGKNYQDPTYFLKRYSGKSIKVNPEHGEAEDVKERTDRLRLQEYLRRVC